MAQKGRTKGPQKMPKPPVNQVEESRCPKCDSTEREDYHNSTEQEFGGTDPKGKPYTHIVRRRTKCVACGQERIDRSYENRISS